MDAQAPRRSIVELLDDDVASYTVAEWRRRNIDLFEILAERGLLDAGVVSHEAHRFITDALIHVRVGAANDPQNAGHVRAQNENVVYYGLAGRVEPKSLTISLESGFIHDLNKAFGEPLRTDEHAVKDEHGQVVSVMTTMAQIVGLNHLGERTRRVLEAATRLPKGALTPAVAKAIDRCIVHHGPGSSRFIQELLDGKNAWWGTEFVDPKTGTRKIVHPGAPPLTLESVIHDLADSTQQMQGGAAWFMKYPAGFWRGAGRSYAGMISGDGTVKPGEIPLSLAQQIDVETATCVEIIERGEELGVLDRACAESLQGAVKESSHSSRQWLDKSDGYLADPNGISLYHDVARALGLSAIDARARLESTGPGSADGDVLEEQIWASGQRLDRDRARDLAHCIETI